MNERKFTPRAEESLRLSQEAAGELGHGYVGTEHLLLGILKENGTMAMRVLTDPAETGACCIALPQDVEGESYDFPSYFFEKRVHRITRPVAVEEGWSVDDLEAAIHAVEHELYPEVLRWLAADRVKMDELGRIHVLERFLTRFRKTG